MKTLTLNMCGSTLAIKPLAQNIDILLARICNRSNYAPFLQNVNKSRIILLVIILFSLSYTTKACDFNSIKCKDTTLILAFEICSDSTILNCWYENLNDTPIFGLFIYDTLKNEILYRKGYYVFRALEIRRDLDSINYLSHIANRKNDFLYWNEVEIGIYSLLESKFTATNMLYIRNENLNRKITRNSKKIMKGYAIGPSFFENYIHNGNRLFYLFKMHIEYQESSLNMNRTILHAKRLKKVKIPLKYITKIKSVETYR